MPALPQRQITELYLRDCRLCIIIFALLSPSPVSTTTTTTTTGVRRLFRLPFAHVTSPSTNSLAAYMFMTTQYASYVVCVISVFLITQSQVNCEPKLQMEHLNINHAHCSHLVRWLFVSSDYVSQRSYRSGNLIYSLTD